MSDTKNPLRKFFDRFLYEHIKVLIIWLFFSLCIPFILIFLGSIIRNIPVLDLIIFVAASVALPIGEISLNLPMIVLPLLHIGLFPGARNTIKPAISGALGVFIIFKFSPFASMPINILVILVIVSCVISLLGSTTKSKKSDITPEKNFKYALKTHFATILFFGAVYLIFFLIDPSVLSIKKAHFQKNPDSSYVVESSNKLAFKIYKKIKKDDQNLVFSNFVLYEGLAILYAGASGNTEKELKALLEPEIDAERLIPAIKNLEEELLMSNTYISQIIKLKLATSLWIQDDYPFRKSYLDLIESNLGKVFHYVNFKQQREVAIRKINNWISKHIPAHYNVRIPEKCISDITSMIIINTIYFKGKWLHDFDPKNTRKDSFYITPKNPIKTDMMDTREAISFRYYGVEPYLRNIGIKTDTINVIELPYKLDSLSMVIFYPNEGSNLVEFEESFTYEKYKFYLNALYENSMELEMPKFKFRSEPDFKDALEDLGVIDAFKWPEADFSKMDELKNKNTGYSLFISNIFQISEIEVNEEGTEAMAINFISLGGAFRPERLEIKGPFMYVIRHKATNQILFIGRVYDPSKNE